VNPPGGVYVFVDEFAPAPPTSHEFASPTVTDDATAFVDDVADPFSDSVPNGVVGSHPV
jgi:hypothetical protein